MKVHQPLLLDLIALVIWTVFVGIIATGVNRYYMHKQDAQLVKVYGDSQTPILLPVKEYCSRAGTGYSLYKKTCIVEMIGRCDK
jgi:hypothetical protein